MSILLKGVDVRELRESKELTQAQLAEKTGLSQTAISHIEKGLPITAGQAFKLAKFFDLKPDHFYQVEQVAS